MNLLEHHLTLNAVLLRFRALIVCYCCGVCMSLVPAVTFHIYLLGLYMHSECWTIIVSMLGIWDECLHVWKCLHKLSISTLLRNISFWLYTFPHKYDRVGLNTDGRNISFCFWEEHIHLYATLLEICFQMIYGVWSTSRHISGISSCVQYILFGWLILRGPFLKSFWEAIWITTLGW